MSDDLLPLLKVHEYFQGASDEALHDVVQHGRLSHHAAGTVVHEANVLLSNVCFVLRGRLKAVRIDARGTESLFRMIDRGDQFGMMVGALAEPVPVRIVALESTTILSVDYEEAMELTLRHADLRRLWLKTYAGGLRKHFFGAAPRRATMMLALIHESPTTRRVAQRLIGRLREVGEKLAVFSDSDEWRALPDVRFRSLHVDGRMLEAEEVRRQAAEWQDASRIVFDAQAGLKPEVAARLMELVDRAVYFVPAGAADGTLRRLQELGVPGRGWRDKTSIVWLLDGSPVGPVVPNLSDFACRDFKIAETPPGLPYGRALANGMERLVHDLRGVRIGLALGGGAARGMSHLGVLDGDYSANRFSKDLRPSWLFRQLPRGNHWYLLYKYRHGHFDPMLRKYLHHYRLEQLAVPCLSITADLVSGTSVVRDRGDAVHAVLSMPIVRGGQALIDGGLVNNIPAEVLVKAGCNFVIAVSVTAKMEKLFCEITPDRPTGSRTKPTTVQTILRSLLVQNHSLNSFGVQPADVVIEPDVTSFDLTEFMRSKELAAVGEAAALEQIPKIRQLLARLDPQLFRLPGDTSAVRTS